MSKNFMDYESASVIFSEYADDINAQKPVVIEYSAYEQLTEAQKAEHRWIINNYPGGGGGGGTLPDSDIRVDSTATVTTASKTATKQITVVSGDGNLSLMNSDPTVCTATLSGTTITITGLKDGTATITVIMSGTSNYKGTTRDITVTASSADGSTVTPINDISTWLKCIWTDKNYTTLAEVIADSQTLLALISDNNAVDYMVRSTNFIVGKNLVERCEHWVVDANGGMVVSPSFDVAIAKVVQGQTYTMTTDSLIDGIVVCGFYYENPVVGSVTYNSTRDLIQPTFVAPITGYIAFRTSIDYATPQLELGSTATAYEPYQSIVGDALAMLYIGQYNYCADTLLADNTWSSAIIASNYWDLVLSNLVPEMTSATTPSGECFTNGTESTNYPIYKAFSSDVSGGTITETTTGKYIGYGFESATKIAVFKFRPNYSYAGVTGVVEIIGSDDKNTWTVLTEVNTTQNESVIVKLSGFVNYRYYALRNKSYTSGARAYGAANVQMFGRTDVTAPSHTLKTFATATDAEIAEMVLRADRGEIDLYDDAGWRAGQEHEISISPIAATGTGYTVGESQPAQTQTLVLMHKGLYELVDSVLDKQGQTRTTCSFVVGLKECMTTSGYMNSTDTNSGSWDGCARRNWCNYGFRNAILSVLRAAFKQFKTVTAQSYNGSTNQTSNDYFALPATKEVDGTGSGSNGTEAAALTQFTYYETSSNRIKNVSWFNRSPYKNNATSFQETSSDGNIATRVASGARGISPFGVF